MERECFGKISNETALALALLLEREKYQKFKKSSIDGVMTRRLNRNRIPLEVEEQIDLRGERVGSFFVIKTISDIPLHLHEEAGEMYLGGSSGIVVLDNPRQNRLECEAQPDLFTVVRAGGSHGLTLGDAVKEMLFCGIKFE